MNYIIYEGTDKEFRCNSIKELSKHVGINVSNLSKRIRDYKKYHKFNTLEEAIEFDKIGARREKRLITVFKGTNKEFTGTQIEIAKHFRISYKGISHTKKLIEDFILDNMDKSDIFKKSDKEILDILTELFSNPDNDDIKYDIKDILNKLI